LFSFCLFAKLIFYTTKHRFAKTNEAPSWIHCRSCNCNLCRTLFLIIKRSGGVSVGLGGLERAAASLILGNGKLREAAQSFLDFGMLRSRSSALLLYRLFGMRWAFSSWAVLRVVRLARGSGIPPLLLRFPADRGSKHFVCQRQCSSDLTAYRAEIIIN